MKTDDVIQTFMDHLVKSNYVKGTDFLKRQFSSPGCTLSKRLIDTLCDFALAEDNYSEMKFQPEKPTMFGRKDNENYLDYVYKTLLLNLGKILFEISNIYVKNMITSLMQYINVKIMTLGLYIKLKEVGSSNAFIDYGELQEIMEKIPANINTPSPVDGLLKILHYELSCMRYFIDCHLYLGMSLYIDSLLSMKKGTDIMLLWESSYEHRETSVDSMFMSKNTLPALILWFKKFKLLSLAKFTLYFYELLLEQSSFSEINDVCIENNIHIFDKISQIQIQSKAQSLILVYDTAIDPNQKGHGVWGPITNETDPLNKYKILLSFPKFKLSRDVLGILITEYNKGRFEMNKIDLVVIENAAYIIMKVDLKITLIMCYDSKPKNEKKLKSSIVELVSKLRCHKLFTSVNRYKDHYYHV